MNVVNVDKKMVHELGPNAAIIAQAEGLTAHACAVQQEAEDKV
jgi:histidinol dehydrogenase